MPRAPVRLAAFGLALVVVLAPLALAATPLDLGTEAGIMVAQAVHTLGGTFVDCAGVAPATLPADAQVACARVPADMFGYFKMGVHGRLYEYLDRGTLQVVRPWHAADNVLEVVYDMHGSTLTVERVRVNGQLYGVFELVPAAVHASSGASKP